MHLTLSDSAVKNILFFTIAFLAVFILSPEVFAGGTENGGQGRLPYEGWLEDLRSSMTGPVALTFALLGIVGAGGSLIFMGAELNGFMRMVLFLVLVISIIIGANDFLDGYTGTGAEIAMTYEEGNEILLAMAIEKRVA